MADSQDFTGQVTDWYRNTLGRDPDSEGLQYWSGLAAKNGAENAFGTFKDSANYVLSNTPGSTDTRVAADYGTASKKYKGPQSSDQTSMVDDWARNMGVTGANTDKYNKLIAGGMPPQSAFAQFQNEYGASAKNPDLNWFQASQIGAGQAMAAPMIGKMSGTGMLPSVAKADPQQAQAYLWAPAGNQLVQNQMGDLLSKDNPLVRMAETQGLEAANRRGLLNSSLAAEAGALAHYQYAMPIATADASTEANAARTNAENQTQVSMSNANLGTQVSLANANSANDMTKLDKQIAANHDQLVTQLDSGTRTSYLNTLNAAQLQFQNFINQIQAADMPAEAKTAQIQQAQVAFNSTVSFLQAAYGNMPSWQQEWSLAPATMTS